jgi:hypothetical protein
MKKFSNNFLLSHSLYNGLFNVILKIYIYLENVSRRDLSFLGDVKADEKHE